MAVNVNHGPQGSPKSQFSIQRVDSSNGVNSDINRWQTQASTLPFRHPDRALIAHNIATYHMSRYEATRQKGGLDQAVVGYAEALLRGMNHPLMNILTFEHLTHALVTRFNDFGARDDPDYIISYLRHLSSFSPDVSSIKRVHLLNVLASTLLSRFEVEWRPEDIEDSIALLQHAITIVPTDTDDYHLFTCNLANTWGKNMNKLTSQEISPRLSGTVVQSSHPAHWTIHCVLCASTTSRGY